MKKTSDPPILTKNRNELKDAQYERYGYNFCQHCRKTTHRKHLHGHHIIYRSEAPNHPNLHDKENLILVCPPCHDKFHFGNKREIREPLVVGRKLRLIFKEFPI